MKAVAGIIFVAFGLAGNVAWGYGGGGSSSASCTEPSFSEALPGKNAVVPQLAEVFVVASANTDLQSLEFEVGQAKVKPDVVMRRSGEFELKAKLPSAVTQPGRVRIALTAKSKDGCAGFFPYFIDVKP